MLENIYKCVTGSIPFFLILLMPLLRP